MKRLFLSCTLILALACAVFSISYRSARADQPSPRASIDLSGPWLFWPDKKDEGMEAGCFKEGFDTTCWRHVTVPLVFDHCGLDLDRYYGVGWFKRSVFVPATMKGKRVVLHFEGINYNAVVWVNGKRVGENHDAFLPFNIPVSDVLRYGSENQIVVRSDNVRSHFQFPLFEGWLGQGGFQREASLVATDPLYIDHVGITARPGTDQNGRFLLKATLTNDSQQPMEATLQVVLTDRTGKSIAKLVSEPVKLEPGKDGQAVVQTDVSKIEAWSPDSPVLYTANVDLLRDGRRVDCVATRFGFRVVETKNAKLFLNGKPIFLMGFNRHEDSPRTGMAVDLQQAKADFQNMKRIGCNFVRLCHYPHHPGELDLCDELGLLVMDENGMNEWGQFDHPDPNSGYVPKPEEAPMVIANGERTLSKLVQRDMNHPSVIIFSVGNESHEEREDVMLGNSALIEYGKKLDPTRLWTHVSNRFFRPGYQPGYYRSDDIICVNSYTVLGQGANEKAFQKAPIWFAEKMEMIHKAFPQKPIMVSEGSSSVTSDEAFRKRVAETEFRAASSCALHGRHVLLVLRASQLAAQQGFAEDQCLGLCDARSHDPIRLDRYHREVIQREAQGNATRRRLLRNHGTKREGGRLSGSPVTLCGRPYSP